MKVLGINGSPRKNGNTAHMLREVFGALAAEGIETEFVQLGGRVIRGCTACRECFDNKDGRCVITKDSVNDCIAKMQAADGILLGSPTYFADLTPEMKALIDRAGFVARANGHMFQRKAGAAVVAARRAGAIHVLDSINHFFLISQMIVPGSSYWNLSLAQDLGDFAKDAEGVRTMQDLGRNMAWLLRKLQ